MSPTNASAPPRSRAASLAGLVGWLVVSYAAAGVGAVASVGAAGFYAELARPAWAPPPWLFGPVWNVLYAMMAVAAWLMWRKAGFGGAMVASTLFLVQLVVNALWSWLFFAWRLGGIAFADIVVLWILIAATITAFARTSKWAAVLLLPYLGWVSYAVALNLVVWRANPQLLG